MTLNPDQFFHGTPSGDLRGGHYGLHVGTRQAALDALNARIGRPATGEWDGTRIYGQTKLAGSKMYGIPEGLPSGRAEYSSGEKVPLDSVPDILSVQISGPMTNTPRTPHEDFKANGYMAGQVKRGTAKRGYYYTNVAEDEGSISAVVPPGGAHLKVNREPKQMRWDM